MTKQLKEIEIPFGAKDSELCGWEYTIPDGMKATIIDNKIVVKKKESDGELADEYKIEQGEKNPTWSEEDDKKIAYLMALLQNRTMNNAALRAANEGLEDWLKSLKERVQIQPKQELSEEEFAHIVGYLVQDVVANEHMPEEEKQPTKFFVEKYYNKLRTQSQVVEHWEKGRLINTRVLKKKKVVKDNFCRECQFFSYNAMGAGFCGLPLIKGEGQRVPQQQYNNACDNFELRKYERN